jgi:hypothetical protein
MPTLPRGWRGSSGLRAPRGCRFSTTASSRGASWPSYSPGWSERLEAADATRTKFIWRKP